MPGLTLERWSRQSQLTSKVIAITVGDQPLCVTDRDQAQPQVYPPGWQGLLAFRTGVTVIEGNARILPLMLAGLVKLQMFIDQAMPSSVIQACQSLASLVVPPDSLSCDKALEHWYIARTLSGEPDAQVFAGLLRQGENYRLVHFLLMQGASSEKLGDLARRYGVSVSHFRRLCHHALGGAAKSEMREWRTAQALLAMTKGKQSLTDVALEFGFSSSSHFSKEIRKLVGVKPSSLIDITRLSSK